MVVLARYCCGVGLFVILGTLCQRQQFWTMARPISLIDAVNVYRGEVHQYNAWLALESSLSPAQLDMFGGMYRRLVKPPRAHTEGFPLDVQYFYQRDSQTGHGERSCQASAVAMAVEYLEPDLVYDDEEYLNIVFKYGDTVSQLAHKKALDGLGIWNQFKMNGQEADLIDLLEKGYPVPIGVLHKGHIDSPSGGGHWITLIGFDETHFYVHDPFGEMDMIFGGYTRNRPKDGMNVRYPRERLMSRWLVASDSDGWYWDFSSNNLK